MKKAICVSAASLIYLMTVLSSIAESEFSRLFDAAYTLAFETENVTLSGKGDFYLDGEWFKTFAVTCMQEGRDSLLTVDALTPIHDGGTRESGFRVLGKDGRAYYWDRSGASHYYSELRANPDAGASVISSPEIKSAAQLADGILKLLDGPLPGVQRTDMSEGGSEYTLLLSAEELPSLLQQAVFPVLTGILEQLGYPFEQVEADDEMKPPYISFSDRNGRVRRYTGPIRVDEALYGWLTRDLPEEEKALFGGVPEKVWECFSLKELEKGMPYILIGADGSVAVYHDFEGFRDAGGIAKTVILGRNEMNIFGAYYEARTGSRIDPVLLETAAYSGRYPELAEELWRMMDDDMYEWYRDIAERDEKAIGIRVWEDGLWELLYTPEDIVAARYDLTRADRIRWFTRDMTVSALDMKLRADDLGRLVAAEGEAVLELIYMNGERHTVTAVLSCASGEFGSTRVSERTPSELSGLPSLEEYYSSADPWTFISRTEAELPEIILLDGKEYRRTEEAPSSEPAGEIQVLCTQTPEPPGSEVSEDTVLYFNPEGGRFYHLREDCPSVSVSNRKKLLSVTWAELLADPDALFSGLRPCSECGAPERP